MIIALSGNDASGKSTIAQELRTKLPLHGFDGIEIVEEFNGPLINLAKKRRGRAAPETSDTRTGNKHSKAVPYLVWTDLLLAGWSFKLLRRNKTVIVERFALDYLATWHELGISSRVIDLLYTKGLPSPDLAFLIEVNPENALVRRGRQRDGRTPKDLEFYVLKTRLYKELSRSYRFVAINNNLNLDDSITSIIKFVSIKKRLSSLKTIAISGLDGSGKSTTVAELTSLLTRLNIPHKTLHFYYNYSLLKLMKRVRKPKEVSEAKQNIRSLKMEAEHKTKARSIRWSRFVLADAALQYFFARLTGFNKLIVFDRFFQDYIVSFNFLQAPYDKQLLEKRVPKADRHFLQIADHEVLYRRKPEHTPQFFKECYNDYMRVSKSFGLTVLDSTNSDKRQILDRLLGAI